MKAEYDRCALARKKTEVAHWFIQKKATDPNITYADALRSVWPEKLEECQKDWNTKVGAVAGTRRQPCVGVVPPNGSMPLIIGVGRQPSG